ncbi:hypothetical protein [Thioalkalivibrio sp. XN279]|uniref:hypothetical protein n=1 Tax=Thioalkalivibrio sp. XN279 TaxID=2714953 RepID=UPI00140D2062|nr:hypothetical protein [Thioalkalivibrio sp. XN279]NHA14139.1 hypothetical protein [Thioalkalivibrio sp. XN279]
MAKLAEKSFVNLWTYPNVYRDQGNAGNGNGKEVCDLLVVCGDDVLVFSDKTIAWPENCDLAVAWQRWFRRAVWQSLKQVNGAMRWIDQFPDRLFIDRECSKPVPISLPPPDRRRMHGIIVALGAGEACRSYFGGGSGSLMVTPSIVGEDHLQPDSSLPFSVGDVNPNGPFVHVLDDVTLDVVMQELDTVRDMTEYLRRKERLIRRGQLISAAGEEELVAYYTTHMSGDERHDFTTPDGTDLQDSDFIAIEEGTYDHISSHPQYLAKKNADQVSYVWDRLIEHFTRTMLDGTVLTGDESDFDLNTYEAGIRHMALVPRFLRRVLGQAFLEALENGRDQPRFSRAVLMGKSHTGADTAFYFMTLAVPDPPPPGGYEHYREVRRNFLRIYALLFLRKYPHLQRVIGIGTEPPPTGKDHDGSSQDLLFAEQPEWTDELHQNLDTDIENFGIMRPGTFETRAFRGEEFPKAIDDSSFHPSPTAGPNRRTRRMLKAKARRKKKGG